MYWATFNHRHPSVRPSLWLTWFGLGMSGQLSQASPTPSPSRSSWSLFWTRWQLSKKFFRPAVTTEEGGDAFWTLVIIDNYLHVWYIHRRQVELWCCYRVLTLRATVVLGCSSGKAIWRCHLWLNGTGKVIFQYFISFSVMNENNHCYHVTALNIITNNLTTWTQ